MVSETVNSSEYGVDYICERCIIIHTCNLMLNCHSGYTPTWVYQISTEAQARMYRYFIRIKLLHYSMELFLIDIYTSASVV